MGIPPSALTASCRIALEVSPNAFTTAPVAVGPPILPNVMSACMRTSPSDFSNFRATGADAAVSPIAARRRSAASTVGCFLFFRTFITLRTVLGSVLHREERIGGGIADHRVHTAQPADVGIAAPNKPFTRMRLRITPAHNTAIPFRIDPLLSPLDSTVKPFTPYTICSIREAAESTFSRFRKSLVKNSSQLRYSGSCAFLSPVTYR